MPDGSIPSEQINGMGSPHGVSRVVREGIEKKQENFAEEIAKQLGK